MAELDVTNMLTAATLPPALYNTARALFHYTFPKLAFKRLTGREWQEEEIEMSLLAMLANPAREALDVGANVGLYSKRLAALVTLVHAFEPHPRLAYVLKRNLPDNVIVRRQAASDHAGAAVLTVPFLDRPVEGLASITSDPELPASARGAMRIRVPTMTLDELADRNIGFVKIDVEGHEASVLCGADALIRIQRPVFLVEVEERHRAGSVAALFEFFSARSYRGVFAWRDKILPVEDFNPAMQNLRLIRTEEPRKNWHYVNNFMFKPRETWSAAWEAGLTEALMHARGSGRTPSTGKAA